MMKPMTATNVPKVDIRIGIMLFLEKTGSWRSFITQSGGIIKANGAAATTPCNETNNEINDEIYDEINRGYLLF